MSTSFDQSFITQFDSEVFVSYQRTGSILRGFCREKNASPGQTVRFQRYGTGTVGTKALHGDVPTMNATHDYVEVTTQDYYGGEFINDIDELKTNINERQLAAEALAKAAGRKMDSLINTAVLADMAAGNIIAANATGFSKAKALKLMELMSAAEIPDDGQRVVLIGAQQYTDLMGIAEFASADYVGNMFPWNSGVQARQWLGFTWVTWNGLTKASTTRKCLAWHKPAVGVALVSDFRTNFDWVPTKSEWFSQIRFSANCKTISNTGTFEIDCIES